jgi:hypothetical protein
MRDNARSHYLSGDQDGDVEFRECVSAGNILILFMLKQHFLLIDG